MSYNFFTASGLTDTTTAGQILESDGSGGWDFVDNTDNVTKTGAPDDSYLAVWDSDGVIKGDGNVSWDGSTFTISGQTAFGRDTSSTVIPPIANDSATYDGHLAIRNAFLVRWVSSTNAVQRGGITADSSSNMLFYNVSTENMRLDSSGNLGIGTTPSYKLDVAGNASVEHTSGLILLVKGTNSNSNNWIQLSNDAQNWNIGIDGGDSDRFYIYDETTVKFEIDPSGSVTINGGAGPVLLSVVGTGADSAIELTDDAATWNIGVGDISAGNDVYYIYGGSSPGRKFQINQNGTSEFLGPLVVGSGFEGSTAPDNGLLVEGSVGIGDSSIDAAAILELTSTSKGFLPPRMTEAEKAAISSPAEGLMVWNTTSGTMDVYDGSLWKSLAFA
jgi:hypothetical protein